MELEIHNRRYIGSKRKLLDHIYHTIREKYKERKCIVADLFAGTGVVSDFLFTKGYNVIVNDILYSNYVAYNTWLGQGKLDNNKITRIISRYNNLDANSLNDNYFSDIYGNKYFSKNDAKKIGYIRDDIEHRKNQLTKREYYALITSLMYATDRIANTVGHFESYLQRQPKDKGVIMHAPKTHQQKADTVATIYNEDANSLIKRIQSDILYIDPPYNARQYINFYHVLENLARWEKPTEFQGNSMKFKRDHLKSGYSRSEAPQLMRELIMAAKCNFIIISYNNTYTAKSNASNNKIQEEDLINILELRGKVNVVEIDYKCFNSGKTKLLNHKEKLYICEVSQ